MNEENKTLTVVIDIPMETYNRLKNIINLGDLLEKAIYDRISKLVDH